MAKIICLGDSTQILSDMLINHTLLNEEVIFRMQMGADLLRLVDEAISMSNDYLSSVNYPYSLYSITEYLSSQKMITICVRAHIVATTEDRQEMEKEMYRLLDAPFDSIA